ncbi:hypothetical protein SO802_033587 [Lithocarpus litseifolius]|uniref:Uncharacterized protein n=1 Tax=Lithocarpus litseifolius TaxID=425828 RepID=A0AAW2BFF5_9ROSI
MQQSPASSVEPLAPKEVGRHYASSSASRPKLINQLANSGLDLDKIAQDFHNLKRPIVSPQNEGCTVPIIRLIHYEMNVMGVVEDFVEDADEDMDEDNPEVLDEDEDEDEDNFIDVYPKRSRI